MMKPNDIKSVIEEALDAFSAKSESELANNKEAVEYIAAALGTNVDYVEQYFGKATTKDKETNNYNKLPKDKYMQFVEELNNLLTEYGNNVANQDVASDETGIEINLQFAEEETGTTPEDYEVELSDEDAKAYTSFVNLFKKYNIKYTETEGRNVEVQVGEDDYEDILGINLKAIVEVEDKVEDNKSNITDEMSDKDYKMHIEMEVARIIENYQDYLEQQILKGAKFNEGEHSLGQFVWELYDQVLPDEDGMNVDEFMDFFGEFMEQWSKKSKISLNA